MKSYYALNGTIRYYNEKAARTWKEPPHYHFVNMLITENSIRGFARQYGLPYSDWRMGAYQLNKPDLVRMQSLLRRAWRDDIDAIADIEKGDPNAPKDKVYGPLRIDWSVTHKGIVASALDLWSFMRIAFLQDYSDGRTKVCANQDCPAPHFLQKRKGQEFCSHPCAVLINVRRFRDRQKQTKNRRRRKP
jgi:hypothetical protein